MSLTPPVGPEWITDSGATTTPPLTLVYFLLSIFLLLLSLRPLWSQMVHVFLSHLWVPPVLMGPFVFLMFLLHLLWFTTFFLFVVL
jgi:hypothetical protein